MNYLAFLIICVLAIVVFIFWSKENEVDSQIKLFLELQKEAILNKRN